MNSPRTKIVVLACLLLAGCSDVSEWELVSMQKDCESHGGIYSITNTLKTYATCRDGLWVIPKRAK